MLKRIGWCALFLLATTAAVAQNPPAGTGQQSGQSMGGGQCAQNRYNCADTRNPIPTPNTVWIEEMTWMDVRDAIKAGKTTASWRA